METGKRKGVDLYMCLHLVTAVVLTFSIYTGAQKLVGTSSKTAAPIVEPYSNPYGLGGMSDIEQQAKFMENQLKEMDDD